MSDNRKLVFDTDYAGFRGAAKDDLSTLRRRPPYMTYWTVIVVGMKGRSVVFLQTGVWTVYRCCGFMNVHKAGV